MGRGRRRRSASPAPGDENGSSALPSRWAPCGGSDGCEGLRIVTTVRTAISGHRRKREGGRDRGVAIVRKRATGLIEPGDQSNATEVPVNSPATMTASRNLCPLEWTEVRRDRHHDRRSPASGRGGAHLRRNCGRWRSPTTPRRTPPCGHGSGARNGATGCSPMSDGTDKVRRAGGRFHVFRVHATSNGRIT